MTLTKLTGSVYVFQGPTNIGVIATPTEEAILIDSGLDESTARKVLRSVEQQGLQVKAIINTHSHADHIGGNAFVQARTGAAVYASPLEAPLIRYPQLEPTMLLGGANPWKDMRNKFLMAKPSLVTEELGGGLYTVCGRQLQIISLPGHSLDQIGVLADGVLFVGDAYISSHLLQKHGIPYNVNIKDYLNTLDKLVESHCDWFVPSHGEPTENITADIAANRSTVLSLVEQVASWLSEPLTAEELVAKLCTHLQVTPGNPGLFFLYRTAVMAYLSFLQEQERVQAVINDNKLVWQRR